MSAPERFKLRAPVRRILVLRPRALGDVLLATPALRALRVGFPHAELHLAVDDTLEPLVRNNPHLHRVWCFPRRDPSVRNWMHLYRQLRNVRFDLVLDLHGSPRTAWIARMTGAPNRVGYALRGRGRWYNLRVHRDRDRFGGWRQQYAARANLEIVSRCGVDGDVIDDTELVFAPDAASEERMSDYFASLPPAAAWVGIAPAGTWQAKTYPVQSFARVADRLAARGYGVLLLWGPGERGVVDTMREHMRGSAIVAPRTDLFELAGLVARLDLLVANDSGVKHLAVARGTSTLTVFGPTSPVNWMPAAADHAWIRARVPCVGCNFTRCLHHTCMLSLDHAAVAECAERQLHARCRERNSVP